MMSKWSRTGTHMWGSSRSRSHGDRGIACNSVSNSCPMAVDKRAHASTWLGSGSGTASLSLASIFILRHPLM
eukprot:6133320-Amphidinium_carterae.1